MDIKAGKIIILTVLNKYYLYSCYTHIVLCLNILVEQERRKVKFSFEFRKREQME